QGRIILAGYGVELRGSQSFTDFAVVRLLPDGQFDPSFGYAGVVLTSIGSGASGANAVAIDAQDRIVVAGYSTGNGGSKDFAVARYTTSSALDPSFNSGSGYRIIDVAGGQSASATGVAIDSLGRIVLGGSAFNGSNNDFAVARLSPDGSLDPTFGNAG